MDKVERLPPINVDAEEAVLGSILIDPDAIYRVIEVISESDFYIVKHQWVMRAAAAERDELARKVSEQAAQLEQARILLTALEWNDWDERVDAWLAANAPSATEAQA